MGIPGSAAPLLLTSAAAGGYEIERSVRFNSADTAYLSRTPASAGNRKTWTWAGWVKRSALGSNSSFFGNYFGSADSSQFFASFNTSNQLVLSFWTNPVLVTSAVYSDPSAWMHIVFAFDSTQAAQSDRLKLYINGSQITTFATDNRSLITLNGDFSINAAQATFVGWNNVAGYYFNGYLADVHFIDGQALDPTDFGEFDATTGVWNPKAYTGSYPGNSFHLDFADNSSAAALGYDAAGSNDWTVNNLFTRSVTTLPAVAFDGSGDYLSLSNSSDFAFGTGDFTIECFINTKSTSGGIAYQTGGSTGYWGLNILSSTFYWQSAVNVTNLWTYSASSILDGNWHHIAVSRSGSSSRLFIDGILVATNTDNTNYSGTAGSLYIVRDANVAYLNGFISNFHIVKGTALYTSNFTIPSAPLTAVANTKLLCCQSSSSATAATVSPGTITANGDVFATTRSDSSPNEDSLVDTPTNYGTDTGAGGEVRGNYCTLNPLVRQGNPTLSNGNLDFNTNGASGGNRAVTGTIQVTSGKWYAEFIVQNISGFPGVVKGLSSSSNPYSGTTECYQYYGVDGNVYNQATSVVKSYSTYASGDIISVALDLDNGKVFFAKNGTWQGSSNPVTGANPAASSLTGTWAFHVSDNNSGTASPAVSTNFGQRPFAYSAPSGFQSLCTTNLPAPTIENGSEYFDTVLYTGTGSSLTPTSSLGFSPDLVWIKGRSGATDHALYDTVRGAQLDLVSNSIAAETTQSTGLTAFNSNGFTVGALAKLNTNAATYTAWTWDAGSSTVTNNDGTISCQIRANPSAGCSVVTYTGTGINATVGHGLGVQPQFFIVKCRDTNGLGNWFVSHVSIGLGSGRLFLDLTSANTTSGASVLWNSTAPTSSTFSLGTYSGLNGSGLRFVAYCFAPVDGYSAFGSYTGNGSANGPFVYTGFRPRWVMAKCTSTTGDWHIIDSSRLGYNPNKALYANANYTEGGEYIDLLSNGFRLNSSYSGLNASGATYIYAAFAENPFAYSRAR